MNVFLDMVGCRLNQSEIEAFARQFRMAGHTLVSEPGKADLVVINTCTVTAPAASDSRQKVRQAVRSGAHQVVVTGCHATLNPLEFLDLSGPIQVIGNPQKENLVQFLLDLPASSFEHVSIMHQPVPGHRMRTRAFIKVQDGCDNYCTYCITRIARGQSKSRTVEDILVDIQSALQGGCQEVVLTGVHLGSWGNDFEKPRQLHHLVREILNNTATPRLHLSSIEPWDLSLEFLDLWQDRRLCRHLHLPLQSGCAATLQRMGRKVTPSVYEELVREVRQRIPDVSITTDIITGFPGETELEFSESLAFTQAMDFAGGHVFTFSPRPGTPAQKLPGQVNSTIAKHRNKRIHQLLEQSSSTYRLQHLGQDLVVLWEKASLNHDHSWQLTGLSDNYLRVRAISPSPCKNQLMSVHITGSERDGLIGEIFLK